MKSFGVLLLCLVGSSAPVVAQERDLTYSEYLATLHQVVAREKNAREEIAREQGLIENLRQQIAQINLRIASVIEEKYRILGITERDVLDAEAQLGDFKTVFQRYLFMPDEELAGRRSECASHEANFTAFRSKRVCLLYRVAAMADDAAAVLAQVRLRLENLRVRSTQPVRGDLTRYTVGESGAAGTLWEIANEVYRDPYQWPRIYRANKRRIDRWFERYTSRSGNGSIKRPQDFVLPGRTLEIPQ